MKFTADDYERLANNRLASHYTDHEVEAEALRQAAADRRALKALVEKWRRDDKPFPASDIYDACADELAAIIEGKT